MKKYLFLILFIGLALPVTLHGQTEGPASSIVGEAFVAFEVRDPIDKDIILGRFNIGVLEADVTLTANGDTLRTKTESGGRFSISGILHQAVTLLIEQEGSVLFSGSFELMPGENIVLVSVQRTPFPEDSMLQVSSEPLVTMSGDTWVYHYSMMGDNYVGPRIQDKDYLISRLMGLPCVEYNKRRGTLTISGPAIHKSFVNGAYVFGLTPEAAK